MFPIAYKICVTMGATPQDLLKVVYAKRFSPQIEGLQAAFILMQSTGNNHTRLMWKYGRIFDSNFFASLRTKTCFKFCYILACVLQGGVCGSSHSGIMKIKQFEEVGQEDQRKLQDGSKLLIKELEKYRDPTSAAAFSSRVKSVSSNFNPHFACCA